MRLPKHWLLPSPTFVAAPEAVQNCNFNRIWQCRRGKMFTLCSWFNLAFYLWDHLQIVVLQNKCKADQICLFPPFACQREILICFSSETISIFLFPLACMLCITMFCFSLSSRSPILTFWVVQWLDLFWRLPMNHWEVGLPLSVPTCFLTSLTSDRSIVFGVENGLFPYLSLEYALSPLSSISEHRHPNPFQCKKYIPQVCMQYYQMFLSLVMFVVEVSVWHMWHSFPFNDVGGSTA